MAETGSIISYHSINLCYKVNICICEQKKKFKPIFYGLQYSRRKIDEFHVQILRKRNPLKVILKCALSPELLDCNELNSIFTAETDNLTSLSPKIFVNPFAPTNEIPSVLKNGCAP